jgi:hypothetical protein
VKPSLSSVWWAAGVTLLMHAGLMAAYSGFLGGDVSALLCVRRSWAGTPPFEAVSLGVGTKGYDGQHYYLMARDPWRRVTNGVRVPAALHVRILYPAVCWLLSGGDGRLLVWVMPAVNLAAIFGLAWLGGWLAVRHGLSGWWGLTLPLAVNAGLPALRDLTDPLATLAVCALLAAWLCEGPWWSLLLTAAAALLGRELNLAIVLLLLGDAVVRRQPGRAAALAGGCVTWLAWVVALRLHAGVWPFLSPGNHTFDAPFAGMWFRWTHLGTSPLRAMLHALRMLHLTLMIGMAGFLVTRRVDRVLAGVILSGVVLAIVSGSGIYEDAWSYTRVFAWLPLGLWLASVRCGWRGPLWLLLPAALWPLCAMLQVAAGEVPP